MSQFPKAEVKNTTGKSRLVLFKTLALLFPLILLVLVECGLRLFGYGHDLSLFTEDPKHPGFLVMNKYTSQKYFSQQENATTGNYEIFRKQKSAGTFRVFVLGESTTIGYPYMHNGSFHRWLQYRLLHSIPDKEFEIINLSLTAVNSYTVLDFARQIIHYEPDAILIYTGHNEYYGAMGVGSTSSFSNPFLVRLIINLREFRLVQLINAILSKAGKTLSGEKIDLRENLMKRMAADQQISFNSVEYKAGINQFRSNVNELCQLLSKQKIPVLISNLVSNEKDLKPFISEAGNGETSAQFHYQKGNELYVKGNFGEAKTEFIEAKELDKLRFRAPDAMNQVLEEAAGKYSGITLIDTKNIFEKNSPDHILGKETLLEHVHPNLFGYALLSEAFYQGLKKRKLITVRNDEEISFGQLRKRMPVTLVDSLKGAYEMMILKEGWPFNVPMPPETKHEKTIEEQLAGAVVVKQISWTDAMNQLQAHYIKQNNALKTLKVTEALLLENPCELVLYDQAAKLSLTLNDNIAAITYYKKGFRLENNFERAQQLFITLLKLDRPQEALPYLEYAASHNPSRFSLNELYVFIQQLVVIKNQFEKDSSNVSLSNQLAAGYLKFANTTAAKKYIEKSLHSDPKNAVALKLKKQIEDIGKQD